MKDMIRYGLTLSLICILAAGLLSGVNLLTKPLILAQAQENTEASLKEVLPQAAHFQAVKKAQDIIYYLAYDQEDKILGAAFEVNADGYSSTIKAMAGIFKDGTISSIKILSQYETPGLGSRVTESAFIDQFKNKSIGELTDVQTITGATISSAALLDAVREKASEVEALLKNAK